MSCLISLRIISLIREHMAALQCTKFQPLSSFTASNKTCDAKLALQNSRRHLFRTAQATNLQATSYSRSNPAPVVGAIVPALSGRVVYAPRRSPVGARAPTPPATRPATPTCSCAPRCLPSAGPPLLCSMLAAAAACAAPLAFITRPSS